MRIAVVTSQYPVRGDPSRGRPILQTVEALSKLVPVEVFVPSARYPAGLTPRSYRYVAAATEEESVGPVRVHYLAYPTIPLLGRLSNGFAVAQLLRAALCDFKPDVVLSYWLYPDAYGAGLVARRMDVPLVAGARGSDIRACDWVTRRLTQRALARSTRILTVSEDLKRLAVARFGVPAERVSTVANGCDTAIFSLGDRTAARDRIAVPSGGRLVLYVGRLVAAKGLRELFEAWRTLAASDSSLRIAFVGDGGLREELLRRARNSGMGDRVLLPGIAAPEQVADWMRACDVMCLPSYSEGYPNVLVEALTCGRPVVATPVGGILEIIDSESGVFAPPRDVDRLAEALRTCLSKSWNEVALSRRFARSWDAVAKETLAACEAAVREFELAGDSK